MGWTQSALLDAEIKGCASLEKISQQFAEADVHFHLLRRGRRRDGRQLTRLRLQFTLDGSREGRTSLKASSKPPGHTQLGL